MSVTMRGMNPEEIRAFLNYKYVRFHSSDRARVMWRWDTHLVTYHHGAVQPYAIVEGYFTGR